MNHSTIRRRQRILRLLSRETLEDMSKRDKPWQSLRSQIETELINEWPAQEIKEAVTRLLKLAEAGT